MAKHSNDTVAFAYAEALHDAANEAGALTEVEQQLFEVLKALEGDPRRGEFFASPSIPFEQKRKVYEAAFKKGLHPILLNFLLTVTRNSRSLDVMSRALAHFRTLCNQIDGIAELELRAAKKLDPKQVEKLKAVMAKKLNRKIVIKEVEEPALLGGFVLQHQNQQWDASVRTRMNRVVRVLDEVKFPATLLKD